MTCKNCERLQRKLSPLEDKAVTADYLAKEPLEWLGTKSGLRNGRVHIMVQLPELYKQTYGCKGSGRALMVLGRTLVALGWERSKRSGLLYFCMEQDEFTDYRVRRLYDKRDST